jgi:acyl carrier protein
MTVRRELQAFLTANGIPAEDIRDDLSLIQSGIFDSTALFDLALWVEERMPGLDLTSFNLVEEWDTPAKLIAFLERERDTDR